MLRELNGAFSLLTTLPTTDGYPEQPGYSFAYFPLVGLMVGALLMGVQWGAGQLLSPDAAALVVIVAWVGITGGLHLDGFGDACDGLFMAADPARRLEVMKDSRVGSWAVIGLVMLLLGKWIGMRGVAPSGLILAAVTGRTVMVIAATAPYARRDGGMGGYFRDGLGRVQIAVALLTFAVVLAFFWRWIPVVALVLVIVAAAGWWAAQRLGGGLTGDVYGALCELSEVLVLIALSVG